MPTDFEKHDSEERRRRGENRPIADRQQAPPVHRLSDTTKANLRTAIAASLLTALIIDG